MGKLDGRVAIVAGVSRGIGKAVAQLLAAADSGHSAKSVHLSAY